MLKDAGYATGLCGKWHMAGTPQSWGFAEQDKTPGQRYWETRDNGKLLLYKPDLMHDWSVDFIQRHAAKPFFLWYSLHVPHADLSYTPDSSPETVAAFKAREWKGKNLGATIMADNIAYMDKLIGKLLWRKPIPRWLTPLRSYKSGPVNVARLLVATDRLVFTTLEFMGPLCILDAATGEVLRTCAEAGGNLTARWRMPLSTMTRRNDKCSRRV